MADYNSRIDEDTGITFIEVTGLLVIEEYLPYLRSEPYARRTSRLIADVRGASLGGMTKGTLAKMLRSAKPLNKPGIRSAFVCTAGDDLSKAKLMLAQLEALGYDGAFRVFTDIDKAISWVQEQSDDA